MSFEINSYGSIEISVNTRISMRYYFIATRMENVMMKWLYYNAFLFLLINCTKPCLLSSKWVSLCIEFKKNFTD